MVYLLLRWCLIRIPNCCGCHRHPVHLQMRGVGLDWMTKIATFDHHMLCTWEIDEGNVIVSPAEFLRDGSFVETMLKLLNDGRPVVEQ